MARPPKDRRTAKSTLDAPLSPTEEASLDMSPSGKLYPVVTKHGGREADRTLDPKVFEGAKLTRDDKTKALFRKAVALRLGDWSIPDIAAELAIPPGVVTRLFTEFQQSVDAEDIAKRLDLTAVPLAVDNLVHGLLAGDKDYTLETLKGRGWFKRHSDGGDEVNRSKELPALRIEFVSPAGAARVEIGSATDVDPTLGKVVGAMSIPVDPQTLPALIDRPTGSGVPLAPHDDPAP